MFTLIVIGWILFHLQESVPVLIWIVYVLACIALVINALVAGGKALR